MSVRLPYRVVKRVFDVSASTVLLGIAAPLMAGISICIRSESPGPVFFSHDRVGESGRHFRMHKFRSMKTGSEDLEATLNDDDLEAYYQEYKLTDDPRVTSIGRKLRRNSLDELPQLFNVIKGDMSLVGPRPIMESELGFYTEDEQRRLLSVRPGITGYWQVNGRNEATYQTGRRQELELYYADNASLLLDTLILVKTPAAVFLGKGAK